MILSNMLSMVFDPERRLHVGAATLQHPLPTKIRQPGVPEPPRYVWRHGEHHVHYRARTNIYGVLGRTKVPYFLSSVKYIFDNCYGSSVHPLGLLTSRRKIFCLREARREAPLASSTSSRDEEHPRDKAVARAWVFSLSACTLATSTYDKWPART